MLKHLWLTQRKYVHVPVVEKVACSSICVDRRYVHVPMVEKVVC